MGRKLPALTNVLSALLMLSSPSLLGPVQGHSEDHCDSDNDPQNCLIRDLFDKNAYKPLIRPVTNLNDTLNIEFSLALSQIINIHEVNQVMKTNVWLQIYWFDYRLKWKPELYGNIKSIKIAPEMVWVPDFVLFNNADGNFEVTYKSNCVLSYDSLVYWIPPAIFHSSCSIDVKYFPFDQQICKMKFGSWTHKGRTLTYSFYKNRDKIDLTDYLKSGSWDIIDGPGEIHNVTDQVTGVQKEQIIFEFVIRRKSLFYTVNLIIPCLLISIVSICVFVIPHGVKLKVMLCISVLFALIVFMLLVSKILPPSETTPLVAKYLMFTFLMNLFAITPTIIIINQNYMAPLSQQVPYWVQLVFLRYLPKYLLMSRPGHDDKWQKSSSDLPSMQSTPDTARTNLIMANDVADLTNFQDGSNDPTNSPKVGYGSADIQAGLSYRKKKEDIPKIEMTPELRKTTESVKFIYEHLKKEQEFLTGMEDWKYLAHVLDRLLLLIFLLVTIIGTAVILLNVPHILEFVDQDKIHRELVNYIAEAEKRTA